LAAIAGAVALMSAPKSTGFTKHDKAFYANPSVVGFVRPGLTFQIVSANIAADGTVTVDYKVTDPKGVALDLAGVQTPGPVSASFVLAYIPKGQSQYVTYATRARTSADGKNTTNVATADSGGKNTQVTPGEYLYTFGNKVPSGWDATATHRVGVYGSRNLTEFDLGTYYDDAVLDFVPGGGKPAPRDIVRTAACNTCHDSLSHHGGSRRSVELCIMCHTPQSTDVNSGNTVDFKVMIHKLHDGSSLPSVVAGGKYQMGNPANPTDWSTVVFPADVRRCETCHDQKSGAAQADAYLKNPNRQACGACHDDVNFASGVNHAGGPQASDNLCTTCHMPQGELEFDASIKGGHTIPVDSSYRPGIVVDITKVVNGGAGQKPTVTFTVRDFSGAGIPMSVMATSPNRISLNMAGPTADYGYTSFGSDVTTHGYVTENPVPTAQCSPDGTCTYTFAHAVPAKATGTYAIGIEARRGLTILPGTTVQQSVNYGAPNKVFYFPVDGTPVVKRRQVVDISKCNGCHVELLHHGNTRNNTEYCVLCHNPSNTDNANPAQAVNFSLMVHKIHYGDNMVPFGQKYVVSGTDFSKIRFSPMNNTGTPGDTAKCYMCHVNGSESVFPIGLNMVTTPQGYMNPTPPTTAACTACHLKLSATAHAAAQTQGTNGESCDVCHGANAAFSVDSVHAGK
jgi:OmcA/MtrC family decaheme c-type cytochrome